jgi:pyruvate/2-oxoglutarate dehydrogenase complex dihydrolipoamide dehydrogenase (E3) component
MAVDYDLVIIGSTPLGIYAAETAIRLHARVALVTQSETFDELPLIFDRSLSQIAGWIQQYRDNPWEIKSKIPSSANVFRTIRQWQQATNSSNENNRLKTLAALGVDIIRDRGEFCRLPKLTFVATKRKLRSRSYLLATGCQYIVPEIESNSSVDCLTYSDLWYRQDLVELPENLIVVGNSPRTLQLVQNLATLGHKITLLTSETSILPEEDPEPAMLIQGQLEAEGVKIFTNSTITRIEKLNDRKWIQAGDRAIETEEIIFTDCRQPNIAGLNLAGVNVKYDKVKIHFNDKLQTTNFKIYVCGDLLGDYSLENFARHQVNIALKNALFVPWFKLNYGNLAMSIDIQPNLARVGMTQKQAKNIYGNKFKVIKKYHQTAFALPKLGINREFYQLLVRDNGEILGCTLVGQTASKEIESIALAIKHKIKLNRQTINGLFTLEFSEVIQELVREFYIDRLEKEPLSTYLENWFEIGRNWVK